MELNLQPNCLGWTNLQPLEDKAHLFHAIEFLKILRYFIFKSG